MIEKINIKDFSMSEFLAWLSESKKDVEIFSIEQVGDIACANVCMTNKDTNVLKECRVMNVKDTHTKLCELFDIDIDRKIYELNINVRCGELPTITTKEFIK